MRVFVCERNGMHFFSMNESNFGSNLFDEPSQNDSFMIHNEPKQHLI